MVHPNHTGSDGRHAKIIHPNTRVAGLVFSLTKAQLERPIHVGCESLLIILVRNNNCVEVKPGNAGQPSSSPSVEEISCLSTRDTVVFKHRSADLQDTNVAQRSFRFLRPRMSNTA
ncbi:hypothetical protein PCASD_24061 [Puccinia coronata f. sp. avenae]|uniref:Uncharacterized protein n=1 Tax=Puccinia coronata f. sp. avenae TaxID=200324 RepID=A0A2N5TVI4_9BASI|nr:hypothetical protein PCASD_24061 [Puccinia coronata f. sp. avenae]